MLTHVKMVACVKMLTHVNMITHVKMLACVKLRCLTLTANSLTYCYKQPFIKIMPYCAQSIISYSKKRLRYQSLVRSVLTENELLTIEGPRARRQHLRERSSLEVSGFSLIQIFYNKNGVGQVHQQVDTTFRESQSQAHLDRQVLYPYCSAYQ